MVEGARRERWNHTAAVLALLANCHRDARRQAPFTAADFHPLAAPTQSDQPIQQTDLSVLKAVFIDHRLPEMPR